MKVTFEKNRERHKLYLWICLHTEIAQRLSIKISCVCLKSLHAGKSALATGPAMCMLTHELPYSLWPVLAPLQRQLRR